MTNRSRTLSIVLGIIALILAGSYVFIILSIRSKVGELSIFEAQIQEEQVYARDNHTLEKLLADTKPDIDSLSTHFVSSDGTVPFIESIETLAKSKGLAVAVSSIAATDAPTDGFSWMNVTLSTSGSWSATYSFLKSLEGVPYEINIENVSLNQSSGASQAQNKVPRAGEGGWNATFAFSVLQKK